MVCHPVVDLVSEDNTNPKAATPFSHLGRSSAQMAQLRVFVYLDDDTSTTATPTHTNTLD